MIDLSGTKYVPSGKTFTTYQTLSKLLIDTPDILNNPSEHIITHMEYLKSCIGTSGNSFLGNAFEFIVLDLFIKLGVNEKSMEHKYHICKPKSAEADIYFSDTETVLMLKTSFRERWKQLDRDAIVMVEDYGINKIYGIHFKEYSDSTKSKNIKFINNIITKLHSDINIVSVYDVEKINVLVFGIMSGGQ